MISKTCPIRSWIVRRCRKNFWNSFEAVLITEQHVFRARYCSILMIYYTEISPPGHRHTTDMLATVDHKVAIDTSAECRPTVNVWSPASINRHSTGGESAKINRLWTDWWPIYRLSPERVSIDYRSSVDRGSIEMSIQGIDRHSIANAFTTHDPLLLSLQNTRIYFARLEKWSEVPAYTRIFNV